MPSATECSPETRQLASLRASLAELRAELVDRAYDLERRGRIDAADVALAASARIGEIVEAADVETTRRRTTDTLSR